MLTKEKIWVKQPQSMEELKRYKFKIKKKNFVLMFNTIID